MTPYEYAVLLRPAAEGGFWAEVPALPGCLAQGGTVEEMLANVQEAAGAHLRALREDGKMVPEEKGMLVARVRVGREASAPGIAGRSGTGTP